MRLKRAHSGWILLAAILYFCSLGVSGGILLLLYILAFILGGLGTCYYYGKLKSDAVYGKPHPALKPCSRGIVQVLQALKCKSSQSENLDKRLTGASTIDEILQEVIEYIFRDYVYSWYRGISNDPHFPLELRKTLHAAIVTFANRAKTVNWMPYLTEVLVDEVASHIKLYRQAEELVKKESKFYDAPDVKYNEKLESKFFDLETDMEKNMCRDLVCTSKQHEKQYLRNVSEALLYLLLPEENFDNKVLRYLTREVLVNNVFGPTVELISDPDYVNQCIIWMTADSAFNNESFLAAVRTSDSIDELMTVLDKVQQEIMRHRAKDTGGADDASIKQVLSSLNYVKKVAETRIRLLRSRVAEDEIDSSFLGNNIGESSDPALMPLQVLLNRNIGIQYFNDYLISHDLEMYLNFLLDIECYLKAATEQQQVGNAATSGFDERELSEMSQDIYSKYMAAEVVGKLNVDSTLIASFKDMVQAGKPTHDIFESMRAQVFERLESIYEDFKKDRSFQRLLHELQLDAADDVDAGGSTSVSVHASASIDDRCSSTFLVEENYSLAASITKTEIVSEKDEKFATYNIAVTKTVEGRSNAQWQTRRRYSDFHSLHVLLNEKYADLTSVPFPSKKPFNNMGKEFLEKRASALNAYLQALLKNGRLAPRPGLLEDLLNFLQPGSWIKDKGIQRQKSETLNVSIRTTIKPAAPKLSADFILGDFIQGVGKVLKLGAAPSGSSGGAATKASHVSADKVSAVLDASGDDDNIPVRIMLLLTDEVFDLRRKNQWLRRRIVAIFRQIVKATFGDRINRKILEYVDHMLSAERVAVYLRMLRDAVWPGGSPAELRSPRDAACRLRTRVVCKAKMFDSVADEVRHLIGSDTTSRGVLRVFAMFQHQALNRRLLFVIFEGVITTLFPTNSFERVFREIHSHSKRVHRHFSGASGASSGSLYSTGL